MPVMRFTSCRACGKQIYQLVYPKTGKAAPIEVDPSPRGNIVISSNGTYRFATDEDRSGGEPLYISHFANCARAASFRRKV